MKSWLQGKSNNKAYSMFIFAAIRKQYARRMSNIVICGLFGPALFFHIISKRLDFQKKKVIEHEIRVLIFFTSFSETFLIVRRSERIIIQNIFWFSGTVVVLLFFSDSKENLFIYVFRQISEK
jgi:hypothetical protein